LKLPLHAAAELVIPVEAAELCSGYFRGVLRPDRFLRQARLA
jgi:hypothetical protein